MRVRALVGRYRRETNPLFRALVALAGLLVLLCACALCTLGGVFAFDRSVSQLGPGGLFSAVRVGQPAPDIRLEALDGRTVSLADYRGRPVALNFWVSWCVPCVVEIPELNAAQRDHADAGLVVLAVNAGEGRERVERFAADRLMAYEVLLDPDNLTAKRYGVLDMPTTVWIDAAGVVRAADYGKVDARRVADRLAALLAAATPAP